MEIRQTYSHTQVEKQVNNSLAPLLRNYNPTTTPDLKAVGTTEIQNFRLAYHRIEFGCLTAWSGGMSAV